MHFLKNESKIWFLKAIIFDSSSIFLDKTKAVFILNFKLNWSSRIRIVNRCIITGWAKSILRQFRLSWMELKNYAGIGFLPGIQKWAF